MSSYKVIQDIEAEDHILGPLSLRQFIYALITAFCLYICFVCVTKGFAFLMVLFAPPALFFGFLAYPFGKDQPTEVWALAKIRFLTKSHRRIWNQSGIKELVTITVPKKIEIQRTNGLSEVEVNSRLRALADTIDSRGWAIKNVDVNAYSATPQFNDADSDRLVTMSSIPQVVPDYDVSAADDILDEQSNEVAYKMNQMINDSTKAHRKDIIGELQDIGQAQAAVAAITPAPPSNWFIQPSVQPSMPQSTPSQAPAPLPDNNIKGPTPAEEAALLARMGNASDPERNPFAHLRTIQPIGSGYPTNPLRALPVIKPVTLTVPATVSQPAAPVVAEPPINPTPATIPKAPDPAILNLAHNDDLNVATLAREANKAKNPGGQSQDEVIISLR